MNGEAIGHARADAQRRELPDAAGVYLFYDAEGELLYVGKARSIRKRVASHFSGGETRLTSRVDRIDFLVTANEAEALLAEQSFIKRHRPRFNIRLRDDKSYPYVCVSLDEEYPRVYFTREKHRAGRAYFGPFSSAKRVRETLDLLGKLFQFRTCEGAEPGRRSGSPCLDYYIKRCGAPCVGYVSREEYRRNIDAIVDFLSGRYRQVEDDEQAKMEEAAAAHEFERAALHRDRLAAIQLAVRAPAGRRRLGRHRRPDRRRRRGRRRQRPGLPGARRHPRRAPELLPRQPGRARAGRGGRGVHRPVLLGLAGDAADDRRRPLPARARRAARGGAGRAARRAGRGAGRGARRQAPPARAGRAQRPPRARPGPAAARAPPPAPGRLARRPARGAGDGGAAGPDRGLRHLQPRRRAHRRLDGRLRGRRDEEVRLPALQGARRARRRVRRLRLDGGGARAGG